MNKFISKKPAFTLIELIIVVGMISVLAALISVLFVRSIHSYEISRKEMELEAKGTAVMEDFESETRSATKIVLNSQNSLTYYRFFDLTSLNPSQVRYFISGNQLKIGITPPIIIGQNVTYPSQNEVIKTVADNLIDTSNIFSYFDSNGSELSDPINPAQIRMIGINISMDNDVNNPPGPVVDSTKVSLRNLKDNL